MTKNKASAGASKRKKEEGSEKAPPRARKPRKPKVSTAKEGLRELPFLAEPSVRKAPAHPKKQEPVSKTPPPKASFKKAVKKENVLSHLRPSASLPVEKKGKEAPKKENSLAELGSFEGYCLRHWGKVNLYFLVPASMGAPLLGLWLRPDGMTPNFAVLIFLAVLAVANLISFLLILLVWAVKGAK